MSLSTSSDSPTMTRKHLLFNVASISSEDDLSCMENEALSLIKATGFIPQEQVKQEIVWFFRHLGLDPSYFKSPISDISHHIVALYAAKVLAVINYQDGLALRLSEVSPNRALFIVPSHPGVENSPSAQVESQIEALFLNEAYHASASAPAPAPASRFRVQIYRTSGTVGPQSDTHLRLFVVEAADFSSPSADAPSSPSADVRFERAFDARFYQNTSEHTQGLYRRALEDASQRLGPVAHVGQAGAGSDVVVVVVYRAHTTHSFFTTLTSLYHAQGLHSRRKHVEQTSHGFTAIAIYFAGSQGGEVLQRAQQFAELSSLAYVLPRTSLHAAASFSSLSVAQTSYAYVLWKFAHQFLNTLGLEPALVGADIGAPATDKESVQRAAAFRGLRASLRRDAYTEGRLMQVLSEYVDLLQELYAEFERAFYPAAGREAAAAPQCDELLDAKIRRVARTELDCRVLMLVRSFNRHVLKTNFFKKSKVALSFRLHPGFLSEDDYPVKPFAIFLVIGSEFRGFHVRFADIARGGIRLIRSADHSVFSVNVSTMFDENYNLALTQQKKNKDIPEGGSKGTILLALDHQDKGLVAFKKYIDALLDLLVIQPDEIVDYYQKPEVLFLGPDEGTADMMDWASTHARERAYPFWKSFTTGKSPHLGGIPHDLFGMTTRGVHQYVLGIYRKLNLDEATIKKFQTGGPDGDLGSNEIKISHDKTVAIVDGSGVLYDPEGINRSELARLAQNRKMCENFDKSLLSSQGFFIHVSDTDVTLPDGRCIEKGMIFRNNFHLDPVLLDGVDLFVPCGGRPAAVNSSNVRQLWSTELGRPRFRFIVEGANLFFTHEARLKLEEWGVILFKDASANKGGVTSSSLEVLAALGLSDQEFAEHMKAEDPLNPPDFYKEYVRHVQETVEEHARNEFEALWREHERTQQPRTILTDLLSEKINLLSQKISCSMLWENQVLRQQVVSEHVPAPLLKLVGIEQLLIRIPEAYLKAIFGTALAAKFVYSCGLDSGEFGFYEFMNQRTQPKVGSSSSQN